MRTPPGTYVLAPERDINEVEHMAFKKRRLVRGANQVASNSHTGLMTATIPAGLALGLHALKRGQGYRTSEEIDQLSEQALQIRLARLDDAWLAFEKSFNEQKSLVLTEAQIEVIGQCFSEGEDIYLHAKTEMRSRLESLKSAAAPSIPNSVRQMVQVQLAEPACVPKFNGNELEWANFRDAFMTEIHANARYTDAQKLRKLLSLLEGRAKNAMGTWTTSSDDAYTLALAALCKLYDNEYGTVQAHLRKVFALKPIQQASSNGLREILDTVRGAQRQLLLSLSPEQLGEYVLLHQIEQLLDAENRAQWGMRRTTDALPTLAQMYEFLELRASLLANVPRSSQEESRRAIVLSSTQASSAGNGRTTEPQPKCDLCQNQHHWPYRCPKFRALPIADRVSYVARRKMCAGCFSLKHIAANCTDRACPRCNVRHNSCLCPHNQHAMKNAAAASNALAIQQ